MVESVHDYHHWTSRKRFRSIVLCLGGLHTEMSFLGCIGHLMAGSGLQHLLECIYWMCIPPHFGLPYHPKYFAIAFALSINFRVCMHTNWNVLQTAVRCKGVPITKIPEDSVGVFPVPTLSCHCDLFILLYGVVIYSCEVLHYLVHFCISWHCHNPC